jgi:hypothetical protein
VEVAGIEPVKDFNRVCQFEVIGEARTLVGGLPSALAEAGGLAERHRGDHDRHVWGNPAAELDAIGDRLAARKRSSQHGLAIAGGEARHRREEGS